jgi:hypothetical protein
MSTATDMRDAYLAAEKALLLGQSYRFGDRMLTMANLPEIQKGRLEWERRANAEASAAAGASSPRFSVADFGSTDAGRYPGGCGWVDR